MHTDTPTDIAIVGGGPIGLNCALLLAELGYHILCFAPEGGTDNRTTALMRTSISLLRHLGVWEDLSADAAPLSSMRLVDTSSRLLRAPTILFDSAEIGGGPFAYNVSNQALTHVLKDKVSQTANIRLISEAVESVAFSDGEATVIDRAGAQHHVGLIVGADGRNSICRRAAGIGLTKHLYPQHALAFSVAANARQDGISTEFHRDYGPLVLVPSPAGRWAIVWVDLSEFSAQRGRLSDLQMRDELHEATHGLLGEIGDIGPRAIFPLATQSATSIAGRRLALVGEAAHLLPPIGAQGFNLGLRDVATLAEELKTGRQLGRDIGDADILAQYAARRSGDIWQRVTGVDLMNRSLLSDFVPLHAARSLGLWTLTRIGFWRRAVMRYGMAPLSDLPNVMRDAMPEV